MRPSTHRRLVSEDSGSTGSSMSGANAVTVLTSDATLPGPLPSARNTQQQHNPSLDYSTRYPSEQRFTERNGGPGHQRLSSDSSTTAPVDAMVPAGSFKAAAPTSPPPNLSSSYPPNNNLSNNSSNTKADTPPEPPTLFTASSSVNMQLAHPSHRRLGSDSQQSSVVGMGTSQPQLFLSPSAARGNNGVSSAAASATGSIVPQGANMSGGGPPPSLAQLTKRRRGQTLFTVNTGNNGNGAGGGLNSALSSGNLQAMRRQRQMSTSSVEGLQNSETAIAVGTAATTSSAGAAPVAAPVAATATPPPADSPSAAAAQPSVQTSSFASMCGVASSARQTDKTASHAARLSFVTIALVFLLLAIGTCWLTQRNISVLSTILTNGGIDESRSFLASLRTISGLVDIEMELFQSNWAQKLKKPSSSKSGKGKQEFVRAKQAMEVTLRRTDALQKAQLDVAQNYLAWSGTCPPVRLLDKPDRSIISAKSVKSKSSRSREDSQDENGKLPIGKQRNNNKKPRKQQQEESRRKQLRQRNEQSFERTSEEPSPPLSAACLAAMDELIETSDQRWQEAKTLWADTFSVKEVAEWWNRDRLKMWSTVIAKHQDSPPSLTPAAAAASSALPSANRSTHGPNETRQNIVTSEQPQPSSSAAARDEETIDIQAQQQRQQPVVGTDTEFHVDVVLVDAHVPLEHPEVVEGRTDAQPLEDIARKPQKKEDEEDAHQTMKSTTTIGIGVILEAGDRVEKHRAERGPDENEGTAAQRRRKPKSSSSSSAPSSIADRPPTMSAERLKQKGGGKSVQYSSDVHSKEEQDKNDEPPFTKKHSNKKKMQQLQPTSSESTTVEEPLQQQRPPVVDWSERAMGVAIVSVLLILFVRRQS